MSARSTDLNPNVYVGLSLPLKPGRGGDFEKTKTILDIHRAVYYSLLSHTLEDILKSINGELNKRVYKGIEC